MRHRERACHPERVEFSQSSRASVASRGICTCRSKCRSLYFARDDDGRVQLTNPLTHELTQIVVAPQSTFTRTSGIFSINRGSSPLRRSISGRI